MNNQYRKNTNMDNQSKGRKEKSTLTWEESYQQSPSLRDPSAVALLQASFLLKGFWKFFLTWSGDGGISQPSEANHLWDSGLQIHLIRLNTCVEPRLK